MKNWMDLNGDGKIDSTEMMFAEEMLCTSREEHEAIQVKVKGLGKIGYVANSPYTVKGESMSTGRLYDKLGDKAKGKVVFVVDGGVVCRIINTGREQTEQPCRIS